jgi:hypothetical protein
VIEGKLEGRIEMTGRRGRRCKQLLDDLKEKRRYWKLKEEALAMEISLWKRLRTCRKTDYRMMTYVSANKLSSSGGFFYRRTTRTFYIYNIIYNIHL